MTRRASGSRHLVAGLALLAASAAALAAGAGNAVAAPWCGTTTTQDRAPALTGRSIRVIYAYPSDGVDRSSEVASRMSADVDEIDAWWRGQDPLREPRFDRSAFPCGLQADILSLRLSDTSETLRSEAVRGDRIVALVGVATGRSSYEKELVYYDGPVNDADRCGEGTGRPDGDGIAMVYLAACTDVSSAVVAAHELLHSFGALAETGPPHACPDSRGHPCDSVLDILYPYASSGTTLVSLALDVGRDDYYGHSGSWPDAQDSLWLRLVSQQVRLALAITGRGSVESDVPGMDCAASCATEWDAGSVVALEPLAAGGQRFVRWSGSCTGSDRCEVTLDAARSVSALFAPERFGLVVTLAGKGKVTGAGAPCISSRCARSGRSYTPVRLRATAAKGWRLAGWSGACAGRAATCSLPMTKAASVRARFVRL
jgi:Divergent InlB B-repeat domain